ncbi:MAG: SPFH domain-containing protein [Leifsonia sp.]
MSTLIVVIIVVVALVVIIAFALSLHVITQYEMGVVFRFGRVSQVKKPGLAVIIPIADRLHKVTLRIITMPIQSQGIITKDNVTVDISAVAYSEPVRTRLGAALAGSRDYADASRAGGWIISTFEMPP